MSAAVGVFQGTQERVRNSRGKRAISVRATEVLLKVLMWIYIHVVFRQLLLSWTSINKIPRMKRIKQVLTEHRILYYSVT